MDAARTDISVRTASKYDDCRLLHVPCIHLKVGLTWLSLSDPFRHFGVTLSPTAEDSYAEFRSAKGVNVSLLLRYDSLFCFSTIIAR